MELIADGRTISFSVSGPEDGLPLVFHHGTPGIGEPFAPMLAAASDRGLRTIMHSRPGYAESTPQPGRSVADVASDVSTILDALGEARFVTIGWSGGGPHALACSALLGVRCRAAATIGGVAPYPAEGLDWFVGMAEENVEEFGCALKGVDELESFLAEAGKALTNVQADDVSASLGGLVTEVDKAAITGEFAEYLAASMRGAVSIGTDGWRDDDLGFTRDWGFSLGDVGPVAIWQGDQDKMVPFEHGKWLAANVPKARPRLQPGEGHVSLAVGKFGDILDDLLAHTT